jgi:hypothetical protein
VDAGRFEGFLRAFAGAPSRRAAIRLALMLGGGLLAGASSPLDAAKHPRRKRKPCSNGKRRCRGKCIHRAECCRDAECQQTDVCTIGRCVQGQCSYSASANGIPCAGGGTCQFGQCRSCKAGGQLCSHPAECCDFSGSFFINLGSCEPNPINPSLNFCCRVSFSECRTSGDCCSGVCANNHCGCKLPLAACEFDAECCSGDCEESACSCAGDQERCMSHAECCSGQCADNRCTAP